MNPVWVAAALICCCGAAASAGAFTDGVRDLIRRSMRAHYPNQTIAMTTTKANQRSVFCLKSAERRSAAVLESLYTEGMRIRGRDMVRMAENIATLMGSSRMEVQDGAVLDWDRYSTSSTRQSMSSQLLFALRARPHLSYYEMLGYGFDYAEEEAALRTAHDAVAAVVLAQDRADLVEYDDVHELVSDALDSDWESITDGLAQAPWMHKTLAPVGRSAPLPDLRRRRLRGLFSN